MTARFKCVRKSGLETFTVVLVPVDSPDNRSFFKDLPHGEIALYPLSQEAGALFVEGEECVLAFGAPPPVAS